MPTDHEAIFELISASNYLDIRPLIQLSCAAIAGMIIGKSPTQINAHFGVVTDFTVAENNDAV